MEKQGFIEAIENLFWKGKDIFGNLVLDFYSYIDNLGISDASAHIIKSYIENLSEFEYFILENELLNNDLIKEDNPHLSENELREMRLDEFLRLDRMYSNFFIYFSNRLNEELRLFLEEKSLEEGEVESALEEDEMENSYIKLPSNNSFGHDMYDQNEIEARDRGFLLFHMSLDEGNELVGCG